MEVNNNIVTTGATMAAGKHTLSFGILNDLKFSYGPIHVEVDDDLKTITAAVTKLVQDAKRCDPSTAFTYRRVYETIRTSKTRSIEENTSKIGT